jgi:GNAT superfamily N-acetyltransferase
MIILPDAPITYRRATAADAEAMGVARDIGNWSGGAGPVTIARYLAGEHHPQHARAPRVAVVAEADGAIVGYIAGHLTRRFGCDGELQWLFVAPALRRAGVAAALLQYLAAWFVQQCASSVCVNVDPENVAARAFYGKHGAVLLSEHWMQWQDIGAALPSAQ